MSNNSRELGQRARGWPRTISGMRCCSFPGSSCWKQFLVLPRRAPWGEAQASYQLSCVCAVYAEEFLRFLSWQHLETNVRNQKQICFFCAGTSAFFKCANKLPFALEGTSSPPSLCLRQSHCDGLKLTFLLPCL